MQPVKLPRMIDEPPNILMWNMDEAMPMLLGMVAGFFTGHLMPFLMGGMAITWAYSKFRDGRPDGYLLHLLYWAGVMPTRSLTMPNPYADHYFP